MHRLLHRRVLWLAVVTSSLTACASPDAAPSSVQTGLEATRALSSLDGAEVEQACEGWAAYAEQGLDTHDGVGGLYCGIWAALHSSDAASCETAYADCAASALAPDAETCAIAHTVPDCATSVTVALYEDCMTRSVDGMRALDVDCTLAGDEAEIRARLDDWALPAGCEALYARPCSPFAPPAP